MHLHVRIHYIFSTINLWFSGRRCGGYYNKILLHALLNSSAHVWKYLAMLSAQSRSNRSCSIWKVIRLPAYGASYTCTQSRWQTQHQHIIKSIIIFIAYLSVKISLLFIDSYTGKNNIGNIRIVLVTGQWLPATRNCCSIQW